MKQEMRQSRGRQDQYLCKMAPEEEGGSLEAAASCRVEARRGERGREGASWSMIRVEDENARRETQQQQRPSRLIVLGR